MLFKTIFLTLFALSLAHPSLSSTETSALKTPVIDPGGQGCLSRSGSSAPSTTPPSSRSTAPPSLRSSFPCAQEIPTRMPQVRSSLERRWLLASDVGVVGQISARHRTRGSLETVAPISGSRSTKPT
ncbi:hypothetical protein B0H16DRAFT_1003731 [Mycena metata]|uniref:Uncharacterized protein n=1 Tax=Mycena metata TaxID=1033252 RepID=A0AAD7K1D4_9AGAR|nr:hypothetical protein B0H16DRAFT_1003731 [Mycena metata]